MEIIESLIFNFVFFFARDDQELGMAEITLLSQLSLWERDADADVREDGKDVDDGEDVKTKVCDQTELEQTLEILNLKLYKRKFYKR